MKATVNNMHGFATAATSPNQATEENEIDREVKASS